MENLMDCPKIYVRSICVDDLEEATLLRFLVSQMLNDDQFMLSYEANDFPRYKMGLVFDDSEIEGIKNLLDYLDRIDVRYETSF